MASGTYSGDGRYVLVLDVWLSSQNEASNYSAVGWRLRSVKGHPYAGRYSGPNPGNRWAVNIGGWQGSGAGFGYDFNAGDVVHGSGIVNVYHDPNGYGSVAFSGSTTLVNVLGSATASGRLDLPRIAKSPAAPGTPVFSALTPTSATVTWAAAPTNNGAGIDQYLLRLHTVSPAYSAGYRDIALSGSTLSYKLTDLKPGTTYYAVVYAHNRRGYSPPSGQGIARTLSGAWAWNGAEWRPAEVLVWRGGRWVTGEIFQAGGDGTTGGFGLAPFGEGPFGGLEAEPVWIH